MKIITDSREQNPLWKNTIVKGLKTGDYSIEIDGVSHEDKIAIERKSIPDLFGTLGKGHKRFKAELSRALELEYFAIVIEGPYRKVRDKDFEGAHHIKMKGHVINTILFTIHMKYKVPVFFAQDRNEAKSIINELFKAYMRSLK